MRRRREAEEKKEKEFSNLKPFSPTKTYIGHKRRVEEASFEAFPVDGGKEGVRLDVLGTVTAAAAAQTISDSLFQ